MIHENLNLKGVLYVGNKDDKKINIKDISYVECRSDLSTIYLITENNEQTILNKPNDFGKEQHITGLIKINLNVLINPERIKSIKDSRKRLIEMECGTEFSVSRRKWYVVKNYIGSSGEYSIN